MSALLSILSRETGLSHSDLMRIIRTAPLRYKVFEIPKRNGGTREIAQPARELKTIQRILMREILEKQPVHAAAMAYRVGHSIRDNAAPHAGTSPILKMDFTDFFPSIRGRDWEEYCKKAGVLTGVDISFSTLLFFRMARPERTLKLSIGAPSSPILSNILMLPFDEIITSESERRGIKYTRYADDMTFSGQRVGMLKDMVDVVKKTAKQLRHPSLTVNETKTTFVTTKRRRNVTGITLANDGNLSLGHHKKRLISSQVHHASQGKLSSEKILELSGQLAFANVVEPTFLQWLRDKYGNAIIQRIQSAAQVPRGSKEAG